jgi:hypothetical protein
MPVRLPSASKLPLAMTCAASVTLDRADSVNEASDDGLDIHQFMRDLASMSREEALARVPERVRERCEAIDLEALPVQRWEAEVAFAYDVATETTRLVGYDIGRNYGPRESDTELFVTVDAYALDELAGRVFVGDWKTGRRQVTSARDNWQLRLGALAAARYAMVDQADAAVVRLPDGGRPWVDPVSWDDFDLSMFASDLRELVRRLQEPARIIPVTGEHCRFCPAFASCPAQGRLIAKLALTPEQVEQEVLALLTDENAALAYERWRTVDATLQRVKSALYTYASSHPIHLPDGSVFGRVETEREELDGEVVRAILSEAYGPEVGEKAVEFSATKASVERAMRVVYEAKKRAGEKVTISGLKSEALEVIRRADGVVPKVRVEWREFRPKREAEATQANPVVAELLQVGVE